MEWQPISTAPRDENEIICCCWRGRLGWVPLRWKTNPRTGLSYFGDPVEWDDYGYPEDQPTHWLPIPVAPL
jgi:hypothetical protein